MLTLKILILFFPLSSYASQDYKLPSVLIKAKHTLSEGNMNLYDGGYFKASKKEIETKNAQDLKDFIFMDPNLEVLGGSRSTGASLQIRGLGSERLLILDEGVRQNFQSGHTGKTFSDFSLVESVEILKGPWSSLYGSRAMAGVLSFRRIEARDILEQIEGLGESNYVGTKLRLDYSSASHNFSQNAYVYGQVNKAKIKPLFAFKNFSSSNLRLGNGKNLSYSASDFQEYYSSLEWKISPSWTSKFKINLHDKKSNQPLNPQIETELDFLLSKSKFLKRDFVGSFVYRKTKSFFNIKPYIRETKIENIRLSDQREDSRSVKTFGLDSWWNQAQSFTKDINLDYSVGLDFFKDINSGTRNGSALSSFPNGDSFYYGFYVQPKFIFYDHLELNMGLRYDSFKSSDENQNYKKNKGQRFSGKAYLTYFFENQSSFFAGWGQAFNAPRLQDLYISDMHFPGNFFVPNPALKPEKSNTYETGLRVNLLKNIQFKSTFFLNDIEDYIGRSVLPTTTVFNNLKSIRLYGLESSLAYKKDRLSGLLAYGRVRSNDKSTNEPLPDTKQDKWTWKASYKINLFFDLGASGTFAFRQKHVPLGTSESPSYYVQNLHASYDKKNWEISVSLMNLFDKAYIPHGSNILSEGRNLKIMLAKKF